VTVEVKEEREVLVTVRLVDDEANAEREAKVDIEGFAEGVSTLLLVDIILSDDLAVARLLPLDKSVIVAIEVGVFEPEDEENVDKELDADIILVSLGIFETFDVIVPVFVCTDELVISLVRDALVDDV
jgi:hypothetical protein